MEIRSMLARLAGAALAASVVLGAYGPAVAETHIRIGWATTDADTDSYRFASHRFADTLEKLVPGHFRFSFFPNHQLGDEKEMLQGIRLGTVDAALITNSIVANVEPSFLINDLPFLYASDKQAYEILDGALGQRLLDALPAKGIIGLAFCEAGFRVIVNRVRPITQPSDVVGLKFRVIESPIFVGMFQRLGGSGVPMPFGEVFTALQQGAVDGMENPAWSIAAAKFNEVSKYLSITRHIYSATPLLVSAMAFKKLDAGDQAALRKAAATTCADQRKFNTDYDAKAIDTMKAGGIIVNEIKDFAPFRAKMTGLYDEYRPKIGAPLMDEWLKAVSQ
ncbi:MAG: TRAP transporter substrate-binding protein [Alphaproteobacteria bacterium]